MKKIFSFFLLSCLMLMNVQLPVHASDAENGFKIHFISVGDADSILIQCNGQNMLVDGGYATKYNQTSNKADENMIDQLIRQIPKDTGTTTSESMQDMEEYITRVQRVFKNNAEADNEVTRYLDSIGVTHIDHVIATHAHFDHIGGLISVINRYKIGDILGPNYLHTSTHFRVFMNMMVKVLQDKEYNAPDDDPEVDPMMSAPYLSAGDVFYLGNDSNNANNAKITVLNPGSTDTYELMNDYSITMRVDYKNTSFLLTGDIQQHAQKNIIERYGKNSGNDLLSDIDVLKVPHHGTPNMENLPTSEYYSGNYAFTKAIDPNISVVSTAYDATYPAPDLHSVRVQRELAYSNLYSTAMGSVVMSSDGNTITTQNALASPRKIRIVEPRKSSITLYDVNAQNTKLTKSKSDLSLKLEYRYGRNTSLSYMYVKDNDTYHPDGNWTEIGNDGILHLTNGMHGVVYVKGTDKDGNTVINKTNRFIIDRNAPGNVKIKASGISGVSTLTLDKKNTYKKSTTKPVTLTLSATDNTAIDHYEYQVVDAGKTYYANKNWKKVNGNKVTLSTNMKGRFYVKAVDLYGNSTIRKTTGFQIKHRLGASVTVNNKKTSVKKLGGKNAYPKATKTGAKISFSVNGSDPNRKKYKIYYHIAKAGSSYSKSFKWTKASSLSINRNFKGVIYAKFVAPDKHTTIVKSGGININGRDTTISVSANVKGVKPKLLSAKNTYSIKSRKPISLKVSASYGDPNKYKIQYKIVKKGKAYKKTGGWKNGSKIKLKGRQSARVYVKFINKTTGKTTIRKLGGFKIY